MYKSIPHKQAEQGFCDLGGGGGGQGIISKVLLTEQKVRDLNIAYSWETMEFIHSQWGNLTEYSIHWRPQKYHSLDPTLQGYTNARFMTTLEELKKLKKQDLKK